MVVYIPRAEIGHTRDIGKTLVSQLWFMYKFPHEYYLRELMYF